MQNHITSMCDPKWTHKNNEMQTTVSSSSTDSLKSTVLQTTQVWALGSGGKRLVRMLIDGGSQRSFITEELLGS